MSTLGILYHLMSHNVSRETRGPAAHKKNEIGYQKDIDRFVK